MIRVESAATPEAVQADAVGGGSASNATDITDIRHVFDKQKDVPSSKLKATIEKLQAVLKEEPAAKFLLFVSFDGTRKHLERMLGEIGVKSVSVCGGMAPGVQAAQMHKISSDPECAALLLNPRVASVGLNLTAANHIFFVDAPLSLTQKKQAVGRCYRIGQGRPVTIWDVVVDNTIEAVIADAACEQEREAKKFHENGDGGAEANNGGNDAGAQQGVGRSLLTSALLMQHFGIPAEDIYDAARARGSNQ